MDPRLSRALEKVPRDVFLAAERTALETDTERRIVREGRLLQPVDVIVRMIQALDPRPGSRILEIGTGVGYSAALLGNLGVEVRTVEWIPPLADTAKRVLAALGTAGIHCTREWPEQAAREGGPYDGILVSLAEFVPTENLRRSLAVGGRLVYLQGPNRARLSLCRVTRRGSDEFVEETLGNLRFVHRLGDILVDSGAISRESLEELAAEAGAHHRPLGERLRQGALPEADIYRALAEQRGLDFGVADSITPLLDPALPLSMPRPFLEHHRMIPVRREDGKIVVATCDPDLIISDLQKLFHPDAIHLFLVTPTDYRRLWSTADFLRTCPRPLAAPPPAHAPSETLASPMPEDPAGSRYVSLFESLLLDAIGERSSDIHLERYGNDVRIRMRIDGDLRDFPRYRLVPEDLVGVVNVIKIRADLDIAERRLPQGGRIRVKAGGKSFDLRVQTQPALYGEHAVIRILPQETKLLTVEDLGFPSKVGIAYRNLLAQPSGLILVVGPTGSGKTTTLYAGLQLLATDPTRKVITVEDPIEYAIEKVQQTQVRPEILFTFAHAMRSFVRQDPDVILVGEIRDPETALEAIRASQTGHLVLSTLHCNDTTDAVQRLTDLGMHPNSIASELLAVISQRLARRICEGCRREESPDPDLMRAVFPGGPPPGWRSFKGAGCARCGGYGTFGRVAAVEFLPTHAAFRNAISLHPTIDELRKQAFKAGLVPMREAALDLVRQGVISFGELPFMLSQERLAPEV